VPLDIWYRTVDSSAKNDNLKDAFPRTCVYVSSPRVGIRTTGNPLVEKWEDLCKTYAYALNRVRKTLSLGVWLGVHIGSFLTRANRFLICDSYGTRDISIVGT